MITEKRTHRDLTAQSGLTLVELMVVLTILSALLAGLTSFVVSQLRAAARVDRQTTDVGNGQLAIAALSRDLRSAVSPNVGESVPLFVVAEPNEAHFYAALLDGQLPSLLRIFIDADQRLVEDATPAATGSLDGADLAWNPGGTLLDPNGNVISPVPAGVVVDPDGDSAVRYIASFVVNDPGTPVFTYFERTTTGLQQLEAAIPGDNLTLEQRRRIDVVEVNIAIASDPSGRTSRFVVRNGVRLPAALLR